MVRSRDNQRQKVYNWEDNDLKQLWDKLAKKSILTEDECELLIVNAIRWWGRENLISKLPSTKCERKVGRGYNPNWKTTRPERERKHFVKSVCGYKSIRVKFQTTDANYSSHYKPWANEIKLMTGWALNPMVCLHEVAHLLLNNNPKGCIRNCASHGAEFMRIYLTLMVRFTPVSMSQFMQSARKRRIKISGLTVEGYDIRPYSEFQKTG